MKYTIKQVSEMTGLPIPTLRYYDKEGLLPALEHKDSGYRVFHDIDIQNIEVIECFKKTGMAIKDIREYMNCSLKVHQLGNKEEICFKSSCQCLWTSVRK